MGAVREGKWGGKTSQVKSNQKTLFYTILVPFNPCSHPILVGSCAFFQVQIKYYVMYGQCSPY